MWAILATSRRHASARSAACGHAGTSAPAAVTAGRRVGTLRRLVAGRVAHVRPARASVQDDLDLSEGWAVEVTSPSASRSPPMKVAKRAKEAAGAAPARQQSPSSSGSSRSRPVDMSSPKGKMSLSLLKEHLMRAEQGQGSAALEGILPQLAKALGQTKGAATARARPAPAARPKRQVVVYEDDDGNTWEPADEDEDVTDDATPEFELNLLDDDMEFVEYDDKGRVASRTSASGRGQAGAAGSGRAGRDAADSDDDDEFDFTGGDSNWQELAAAMAADLDAEVAADSAPMAKGKAKAKAQGGGTTKAKAPEGAAAAGAKGKRQQNAAAAMRRVEEQMDVDEDDDDASNEYWGVEELEPGAGGPGGRGQRRYRSLMEELGVVRARGSRRAGEEGDDGAAAADPDVAVTWGGNASSSGVDLDEQERLLSRMFKPHKVAKLMEHQRAALAAAEAIKRNAGAGTESKLHRQLRIVAGDAADVRLLSSRGPQTRPMMEKVRQAIFNMIQSQAGTVACLPAEARWLDLFAGTGSVGLEALSRGVREAHFVEMDPWVTRNVLGKNITACGYNKKSVVHTTKAEDFLRKAVELPRFAGGAFDFISMCPPYLLVSYPELFDYLHRSQLLHAGTILFVEYPKQLSHEVPATVGPLVQVRKRKYGRTHVVVYGPPGAGRGQDDDGWGDDVDQQGDN